MMTEPERKRRKVTLGGSSSNDEKLNAAVGDMEKSTKNLTPVLSDDLMGGVPLVEVFIGTIVDRKYISKAILCLNSAVPLPKLQHLKRVRQTDILICPAAGMTVDEVKSMLKEKEFDFAGLLKEDFQVCSVAAVPPVIRRQYDVAHKLWPCNFHANKYTERLVGGSFFSDSDRASHRRYMAVAYEVARIYDNVFSSGSDNNGDKIINQQDLAAATSGLSDSPTRETTLDHLEQLRLVRGVVVVDPKIDSIVAVGYDKRPKNPCQHAVMVAIDNVARSQHGGAWPRDDFHDDPAESVADGLICDGVPRVFKEKISCKYSCLKFGARPTIRRGESGVFEEVASDKTKETIQIYEDSQKPSGPYLCTDYDVYTTCEPCLMCSMALVHSRAKRVFFGVTNPESGGLVSKCKLHTLEALNHRYEVFSGFF